MRPFEFRVWDKTSKVMLNLVAFRDKDGRVIAQAYDQPKTIYSNTPDMVDIMQFTGLYDKKGVKIFEGDIVKFGDCKGEAWWQDNAGYWAIDWKPVPDSFKDYRPTESTIAYSREYEVIGNIHQNPELLKL